MKKKLLFTFFLVLGIGITYYGKHHKSDVEKLRDKHRSFLENSPFKKTKYLSKKERIGQGLPPNAYNEQMWELTMDPNTGRPMPERVEKLQQELLNNRADNRGGGGDNYSAWVDRGPNNIGGRTRGIMFDPNDTDYNRVFAGGVSGGLWVNEDITDANSSWTLVPGIGANISVTVIISDPNDSNVFYIGSGESYTSGQAIGRGVWKSTDGGVTWSNIFGGYESADGGQYINGIFYVNDLVARDVNGSTELYASFAGAYYRGSGGNPNQFNGLNEQGFYKSTDGGSNWTKFPIEESNGSPSNPNDIEIDINNNVWFTTTRSNFGFDGGKIFRSTDGTTFDLITTIPNANRTELEPSSTDVNKFWVAISNKDTGDADLFTTDDAFTTFSSINEPNDADNGIPSVDYTRGQAFYDLPIEVDVNDNLYVGGIDLFRSTDGGSNWTQISKWSNNNALGGLNIPLVHADHHAIVFRPGTNNENEAVLANDGGVYYTPDITAPTSSLSIDSRIKDYNVTQFYYGTIDLVDGTDGDDIAGGTQDNGTPIVQNANSNANSFDDPFGGDGAYTEIDDSGEYMIQSYTRNNHRWVNYPTINQAQTITTLTSGGEFINQAVLDKNLDIFYSNAGNSAVNRIEVVSDFLPGGDKTYTLLANSLLNGSPSAMQISPFTTTASNLYLGLKNSKLLKIENAETSSPTWTDISGSEFVGSISDIEFGQNEEEIFVSFFNYGITNIWFTNDGGSTWTAIEGNLPDLPVISILQNPLLPNELIIGTILGVWRTSDYTATNVEWTQSFNGMSDVTVVDLDLRPSDNTILATTHGRGMFTSVFTSDVASVDEVFAAKKMFSVYPTISNGDFNVVAKSELGTSKMYIYDINGKRVFNSQLNFNENQTQNVSVNLKSGIYIVNIIGQNNKKSSEKIIIK